MSDHPNRTRSDSADFDALAELFLGDSAGPARPPERVAPKPAHVAGSIGLRVGPTPQPIPGPTRQPTPGTSFDAEDDDLDAEPISIAARPMNDDRLSIEALVVGHLPVRTGLWLSQYAATVAREERRTVGMIRLTEVESRFDLYGIDTDDRPEECESIEEAISRALPHCRRWMILVGDLDVPSLLRSPDVRSLTLLAGGNEAAIVDAYRTIKSLVANVRSLRGESPMEDAEDASRMPAVRLAIMGADRERAEAVAARLRDASRAFLGREIELAPGVSSMTPTGAAPIFRGRTTLGAEEILRMLRREPAPEPTPIDDETSPPEVVIRPIATTQRVESHNGHDATNDQPERPAARESCRPTRGAWPGGLAAHVPGLVALEIPYPDDPAVEFAIDEQGRLHVLRYEAGESGSAVSSLTAAGGWASRNIALINLAIGGKGPIRLDAPGALHLFTSRPSAVRPLLDADLRLHALAPVPRDRDWVSLDLN